MGVVKVNCRKTNRHKKRPYCVYLLIVKTYLLLYLETSSIYHLTQRTSLEDLIFISNIVTQILNSKRNFCSSYG